MCVGSPIVNRTSVVHKFKLGAFMLARFGGFSNNIHHFKLVNK
jgi:hypothetical protein